MPCTSLGELIKARWTWTESQGCGSQPTREPAVAFVITIACMSSDKLIAKFTLGERK